MTTRAPVPKDQSILIVGAGVFGLSTALELKQRGYQNVTIIDRYLPPVVDGSSVDISRVIRVDYADSLYAKMAREAHEGWTTEFSDHYHESGFIMLAQKSGNPYIEKTLQVTRAMGHKLDEYDDANNVRTVYPAVQAKLDGHKAYSNQKGGWSDAEASIRQLSIKCSLAGVDFITGSRGRVISLLYSGKRVVGVNVAKGDPILASQVIISTGAWSNRLVSIGHATTSSGQPVGFIKLTDTEAKRIENMPVIINLSTGVFVFPPTPGSNILKVARHGYGYATKVPVEDDDRLVSSPKRDGNNAAANYLPDDAEQALREGLSQLVPEFAKHDWMDKRLCWYSDTPEGDFVIDHHPEAAGLFLATGGAGQ